MLTPSSQATTGPAVVLRMTGRSAVPVLLMPPVPSDEPKAIQLAPSNFATRISLPVLVISVHATIGFPSDASVIVGLREDASELLTPPSSALPVSSCHPVPGVYFAT